MASLALPFHGESSAKDRLVVSFPLIALCFAVAFRHWPASPLWLPAALLAITIAIWHGAYDAVLAKAAFQPRYRQKWVLPFYAGYLGLTSIVVAVWYLAPVVALVAFLLYSGFHFGTEAGLGTNSLQTASAAAAGFVPIAAACHWKAWEVVPIFTTMLRGRPEIASRINSSAGSTLAPLVLVALAGPLVQRHGVLQRAVILAAELVLFRCTPPVLAFAVFFCAWHTPEHLIETSHDAGGRFRVHTMWRNLRQGALPWLLSLVAVAIAAWMGWHTARALTGLIFIALSALTVPHMTLALVSTAAPIKGNQHRLQAAQGLVNQ